MGDKVHMFTSFLSSAEGICLHMKNKIREKECCLAAFYPAQHCDQSSFFTFGNANTLYSWILKIDSGISGKLKYEIPVLNVWDL